MSTLNMRCTPMACYVLPISSLKHIKSYMKNLLQLANRIINCRRNCLRVVSNNHYFLMDYKKLNLKVLQIPQLRLTKMVPAAVMIQHCMNSVKRKVNKPYMLVHKQSKLDLVKYKLPKEKHLCVPLSARDLVLVHR